MTTGGAISWLSPRSWRDEPGRTAKVLLGEAVVIGTVVAVSTSGGGGGGGGDGGSAGNPSPADGYTGATLKAFNDVRRATVTRQGSR